MKYVYGIAAWLLLVLTLIIVNNNSTVSAQEEHDNIRDLLLLIQSKQPDTQITLDFITKNYSPDGKISHIGDDYVCIFESPEVEFCTPLDKIQSVRMYPGIHR